MLRRIAIAFGVLFGIVVLLVGAAAVWLYTADWNAYRDTIAGRSGGALGRTVAIRGDLDVAPSWRPQVRATDFRIANAEGMEPADMVRAGEVYVQFRVWPLLVGRIEIDTLRLADVDVTLEQRDGRANWQFSTATPEGAAVKAATPKERGEFPILRRLLVEDLKITYKDADMREPVRATLARIEASEADGGQAIVIGAEGTYQRAKFKLDARVGSYALLRDADEPYPATVKLESGATKVSFDGRIDEPVDFRGVDGAVHIEGRNLDELYRLLGVPLPQSPAYRLTGQLMQDGETWRLNGMAGRLGSSDIGGDVAVSTGGQRPKVTAKVTSNAVDMKDIEGFWGAKADPGGGGKQPAPARAPGATVIPDEKFEIAKLDRMDVALDFRGTSVKSSDLVLDNIAAKLRIDNGKVALEPLEVGVIGGTVRADLRLDTAAKVPAVDGNIRMSGLQLKRFIAALGVEDDSLGTVSGRAAIKTRGNSLHQLAANAAGDGFLTMEGGQFSNLLLELMALDLQEAIEQWLSDDKKKVAIGCLIAPMKIAQGKIIADPWVLDTEDALVVIRGDIDLGRETIGLKLLPQPKDYSFFNALTSITVEGDLGAQKADVDKLEALAKLAYKTLLAPLMPLLSDEIQHDAIAQAPCSNLAQRLRQGQ
ncbi:MAG: AsmA family protein [Rhodospirillaceae bacterium]